MSKGSNRRPEDWKLIEAHWPQCGEMRYENGSRVQCVHPNGMGHRGECEFPKVLHTNWSQVMNDGQAA
jgi:hypothetical protein